MNLHGRLTSTIEDQLCMAALHYLRSHYEEATELYKKLLLGMLIKLLKKN